MEVKPGYKQTEVGVIPEEWVCEKLSEFFSFISYGFTNPMPTVHEGIFMITAADINDGRLQLETARKTSEAAYRKLLTAKSKPQLNDVLVTKDGSLGRLALVGAETICINQSVAVIRPNARVEPQFLKLLLESPRYQKRMIEDAGGSTIKHIYITIVDKMPIGLPLEKAEQRAIATALSDVDGLLGGLERLIAKKRDLKQAAMQQLLTAQTRLPGFHGNAEPQLGIVEEKAKLGLGVPGALPVGWEVKRLGELADMGSGGTPPSSIATYYDGEIPWASISDMTKGGKVICSTDRNLTREGFRNCAAQMFPAGTVLYAMYASLGECSVAGVPLCSSQAILGIRPKAGLNGEFLYYFLTSLKAKVKTLGQQGTQANLNKGMVQEFRLSLPSLPEQTAIAAVLSDMDAELAALEQRREKTRALKQAMMQELLTGRTRLV